MVKIMIKFVIFTHCGYRRKKNIELGNPAIFFPSKEKEIIWLEHTRWWLYPSMFFLNVEELKFWIADKLSKDKL